MKIAANLFPQATTQTPKTGFIIVGIMSGFIQAFSLMGCSPSKSNSSIGETLANSSEKLYATGAVERVVKFKGDYQTQFTSLEQFKNSPGYPSKWEIARTVKYLFGPLVERQIGGPQRGEKITALRAEAYMKNGQVFVPYDYQGLWLVSKDFPQEGRAFPVPYQASMQNTPGWKLCGDSAPEHQTEDFFWYFWDPARSGCDQVEGVHYQNVNLSFGVETEQTSLTYPEYRRMLRTVGGQKVLQSTFAFGYVEDPASPNPFSDFDAGMYEFRDFVQVLRSQLAPMGFQESPIYQSEYEGFSSLIIGTRFVGVRDGVVLKFQVVAAAGVDQMMLFAKSYAGDNDGAFSWFGHSRVGSGFDAQNFQSIVASEPQKYRISKDYQLVYWAGCNSYSYYTLPFFEMKSALDPARDPQGTKNLDIISNGLPSFFSLNATNAEILFKALLKFSQPTSFQAIVDEIEYKSNNWMGTKVLVNVLGDEDNLN